MHERAKLAEARHFLDRMHAEHCNPAAFAHELSAFLGAARSVLQHAYEEVKDKPGGQEWYARTMTDPLSRFFRNLRNHSVHEMPVRPLTKMRTETAAFLNIGDDDDEMFIPHPHDTIVNQYEFQDRPGEDVRDLSQQYLKGLEDLVEDGLAAGWISG